MILLISPNRVYATDRLMEEAGALGLGMETVSARELAARGFALEISKYDALYIRNAYPHFQEAIALAREFAAAGKYVVDLASIAGGFETGKYAMYRQLEAAGVPVPRTVLFNQPSSFFPHPYVLKWNYGFGGTHVHLVQGGGEAESLLPRHPVGEWLLQEYIPAEYEYKVITVGYRSLPVVLRFRLQESGFKIDLHRYAILQSGQVPEVVRLAEQASKMLGRELAKTDILERDGKLYVLEVNRSPSLLPFEPYSRFNVAGEFVKYIERQVASDKRAQ